MLRVAKIKVHQTVSNVENFLKCAVVSRYPWYYRGGGFGCFSWGRGVKWDRGR